MKYVLLIFQGSTPLPGTPAFEALSAAEQKQIYADYAALNADERLTPGLPLGALDTARTVTVRDGDLEVRSGPHLADSPGGYFVAEVESLDEAVALAARIPAARHGGAVEVRPAEKYW